jgi:hypothetical protein
MLLIYTGASLLAHRSRRKTGSAFSLPRPSGAHDALTGLFPVKLDGYPEFVTSMTKAMHSLQPFHEACCIAKRHDAVDMSGG